MSKYIVYFVQTNLKFILKTIQDAGETIEVSAGRLKVLEILQEFSERLNGKQESVRNIQIWSMYYIVLELKSINME